MRNIILWMVFLPTICFCSELTNKTLKTPLLNERQVLSKKTSTLLQKHFIYPSRDMFTEYITNYFTSSEDLIQMFLILKNKNPNLDFECFLPPLRKRREVPAIKFNEDETFKLYQFFGRFAHLDLISFSENFIHAIKIEFEISENDILVEFSNGEVKCLRRYELICGHVLHATFNKEEFIVFISRFSVETSDRDCDRGPRATTATGQMVSLLTKGQICENIVDFPTMLEHIWQSYTMKSSRKISFYKHSYFLQKKMFKIFAKYIIFLDDVIVCPSQKCWKKVSDCCRHKFVFLSLLCFFFKSILFIVLGVILVNIYFLPFHIIGIIVFLCTKCQCFDTLLYIPPITFSLYNIFSPMLYFMVMGNLSFEESYTNIQKIYSLKDNEKNLSFLWSISWQISNSFPKMGMLVYVFGISILLILFSPQFWIFVIHLENPTFNDKLNLMWYGS